MADEHEDKDERDDASGGTKLKNFITDMTSAMDSFAKRMDAFEKMHKKDDDDSKKDDDRKDAHSKKDEDEKEEEEKKDSKKDARKDALPEVNEKEEEEDEPKAVAADKKRKDDDAKKDDDRKDARKDAKSKKDEDGEEEDDPEGGPNGEKGERKDSRADSVLLKRIKTLEQALGDVTVSLPKRRSDDDYHAVMDAQARADAIYSDLGTRGAPRPLDGEDLMTYRRRLARDLKKYSPDWKEANIHAVDDSTFEVLERRIYADAAAYANMPVTAEAGTLRAVTKRSGGHEITTWVGEPRTWMDAFAGPVRMHVTSIANGNQR